MASENINLNGQIILRTLEALKVPVRLEEIINKVTACSGSDRVVVRGIVEETIKGGLRYGFIQSKNYKYYIHPVVLAPTNSRVSVTLPNSIGDNVTLCFDTGNSARIIPQLMEIDDDSIDDFGPPSGSITSGPNGRIGLIPVEVPSPTAIVTTSNPGGSDGGRVPLTLKANTATNAANQRVSGDGRRRSRSRSGNRSARGRRPAGRSIGRPAGRPASLPRRSKSKGRPVTARNKKPRSTSARSTSARSTSSRGSKPRSNLRGVAPRSHAITRNKYRPNAVVTKAKRRPKK